jgi:hypothetical protein
MMRLMMAIDPDLFAAVVGALESAGDELDELKNGIGSQMRPWYPPDDLQALLDQREALLATLARVCEGYEKQGKLAVAKRIRAIYAEELPRANADYDMPAAPVMAEVIEQVADALERVRRAKCVDGDVRDALDAARA